MRCLLSQAVEVEETCVNRSVGRLFDFLNNQRILIHAQHSLVYRISRVMLHGNPPHKSRLFLFRPDFSPLPQTSV